MTRLDGQKLREILSRNGFGFSKSLGQNFLWDERILNKIADCAGITQQDSVLEIGPGAGTLTRVLASRCRKVTAVEIDSSLMPVLNETLDGFDNINIINADFLKTDLHRLYEELGDGFRLIANLPYYITTPIIMRVLESGLPYASLTVLVQNEVALRMAAAPGCKDYGSLTCAVQYYCTAELGIKIPPSCFYPAPKVESRVITLRRRATPPVAVNDEKLFFRVVRSAFACRRKTLANNLIAEFSLDRPAAEGVLSSMGIDAKIRGEQLSLAEFAAVANAIEALNPV